MNKISKGVLIESGKFLSLFGLAYIAGMPQVSSVAAATLGFGTESMKNFFGMVGNMVSGFSSSAFSNISKEVKFHVNHDLKRELENAYEKTLRDIENTILEVDELDAGNIFNVIIAPAYYKQIKANRKTLRETLIDPLLTELKSEVEIEAMLNDNGQLQPDQYLTNLLRKHISKIEFINDDESSAHFIEELSLQFKNIFPGHFLTSLKKNENARTAYFKHLLEGVVVQGKLTFEQVSQVNQVAIQTKNAITEIDTKIRELNPTLKEIQTTLDNFRQTLTDYFSSQASSLEEIKELIKSNHAPVLKTDRRDYEDVTDPNLYHFRYQFTQLRGRDTEKSQLYDFIYLPLINNKRFSWCLVTGEGGAGKSRLAQELALEAIENGFYAGFFNASQYNIDAPPDWGRWQPGIPVLIIIDYAFANSNKVIELIKLLDYYNTGSQQNLPAIRLMLLERTSNKNWNDTVHGIPAVNTTQYQTVALSPLDMESQWEIIEDVVNRLKPGRLPELEKDKETWLNTMNDIDHKHRPLFTFLAAVALSESDNIRNWNKHELLAHVNSRMIQFWNKYPAYKDNDRVINQLLVINTLARYMQINEIEDLCYDLSPDTAFEDIEQIYLAFTDKHIGEKSGKLFQEGIQPDILGEYFLLDQLEVLLQGGKPRKLLAEKLVLTSWKLRPEQTRWTIQLAFSDYIKIKQDSLDESRYKAFITALDFLISDYWIEKVDETMAVELSILYSVIADKYSEQKNHSEAARYIENIYTLFNKFNTSQPILEVFYGSVYLYVWNNADQEKQVDLYLSYCLSSLEMYDFKKNITLTAKTADIYAAYFAFTPAINTEIFTQKINYIYSLRQESSDISFARQFSFCVGGFVSRKEVLKEDCKNWLTVAEAMLKTDNTGDENKAATIYASAVGQFLIRFCDEDIDQCIFYLDQLIEIRKEFNLGEHAFYMEKMMISISQVVTKWIQDHPDVSKHYIDIANDFIIGALSDKTKETAFFYSQMLGEYIKQRLQEDLSSSFSYFKILQSLLYNPSVKDPMVGSIWILALTKFAEGGIEDKKMLDELGSMFESGIQSELHLADEGAANFLGFLIAYYINNGEGGTDDDKSTVTNFKKVSTRLFNTYRTKNTLAAFVSSNKLLAITEEEKASVYNEESQKTIDFFNQQFGTSYTTEELYTIN